MLDLSALNKPQCEAVEYIDGPLLVLAGAGSGKTRVLTYRIAHLVQDCYVMPEQILAVTFTNKAAKEMRSRLNGLLGNTRGMWIYTFHSMCVRILRAQADKIGFSSDFTIYDATDSKRLIKEVMAAKNINPRLIGERKVAGIISDAKNKLLSPADFGELKDYNPMHETFAQMYEDYQERLARANAMDFDDLLYYTYLLFKEFPNVAEFYSQNFKYILVDEYQDTNKAQYAITRILANVNKNLMVVGDDDQSIYSWRGADITNILNFERDWPNCKTIKLEENYRSCGNILQAANAVIAHNDNRKDKKLFTSSGAGEKLAIYCASNELDEARWIASEIERLHDVGTSYNDIACFYRTNAQSRVLEDMFLRAGVPYRIVGGTKFFDRAEIRDVCAYLRCAINPADDISAQRVINTPRRGIGKTTIEQIMALANTSQITFIEAVRIYAQDNLLRAATRKGLQQFLDIIDNAAKMSGDLSDVVEAIVNSTGIIDYLKNQNTDEAKSRIENIKEFYGVVADYVNSNIEELQDLDGGINGEHHSDNEQHLTDNNGEHHSGVASSTDDADKTAASEGSGAEELAAESATEEDPLTLSKFMEWLSLRTDLDTLGENADEMVTFMTIHSAKGLEFDVVFVAGLEENIFPHTNSFMDGNIEEERRLAYVAITRAKKLLYLTHAQVRRLYNNKQNNPRSRFIDEIPKELTTSKGIGSEGLSGTGWDKRGDRSGIAGSGRGQDMYAGRVFGSIGHTGAASGKSIDYKEQSANTSFEAGDRVDHKIFGSGVILEAQGDKLTIQFYKNHKTKTLLASYAPLVKIE